jgi:hypothetical protein
VKPFKAHVPEHGATGGALQGQARHVVGILDDSDVEAQCIGHEPVDLVFLRTDPIHTFREVENGAVIDHPALFVTPDAIAHAARLDLADVPCHQSVQVRQGVRPGHQVLDHRGNVEHATGVAACEIFH